MSPSLHQLDTVSNTWYISTLCIPCNRNEQSCVCVCVCVCVCFSVICIRLLLASREVYSLFSIWHRLTIAPRGFWFVLSTRIYIYGVYSLFGIDRYRIERGDSAYMGCPGRQCLQRGPDIPYRTRGGHVADTWRATQIDTFRHV